jgi:alkanesulfonate monooxygenase SsuD/methylene tetrahydromethanopterin reductase-like flavin-dependent oxidoreductase (luciferase family)
MSTTPSTDNRPPLALGLFMPNCSNSPSISTYKPKPDDWTFESNLKISWAAESAGFEFLFPIAKWRGFGGVTNVFGTSLETMTWASAILARTSRIKVFSTVHVPIFHPLMAAKMGGTLDHIGNGRWGLNVVSGWSEHEFGMMGIEVIPHDERYQRTEAYVEILKGLWTSPPGTFNHSSKWYKITDGWVSPLPVSKPHPPIANAGMSEDAKHMVARLCDWAFISLRESAEAAPVSANLRERARNHGRTIKISTYPMVLWADTEREAEQERRKLVEQLDVVAAERWARGLSDKSGSFDRCTLEMFAIGAGALPIVGTAEQAAEQIAGLYRMGIDGLLMCFLDYYKDTLRFDREISPLLRQMDVIR